MTNVAQRIYYGKALTELAARKDIVVLDADLGGSTKASDFEKTAKERFIQIGVAEQNMIGVAAGLAASGKTVFASTFAVFATGRCWEQIRQAVAYPRLNVKIVASHCGISVGGDGASHQALEDMAIMRALPNMTVISPADANEAYAATLAIADHDGPCYMRMGRADFPLVTSAGADFIIGKATVLEEGKDVTLIGTGQMLTSCIEAFSILKQKGISAEVINVSTIKPLDTETIISSVSKTRCVVTAEEHSVIGGLGSAVAECLAENLPTPQIRVGVKDLFGESGDPNELMKKYGLTTDDVVAAAENVIARKRR
ncbi:MAG: transketolase family protein [Methanomassiliicoccaceae archaeon]|nr:transketolase family protein [Methanomassiliicoccaceae archaeon]